MANDLDLASLGVTLDDRDAQRVFDDALAMVQGALPEWVPRTGSIEVILLEALATCVTDLIYASNRVVGAIPEAMLTLAGVERRGGAAATGTVRMVFDSVLTATVTAGTRMTLPDDGNVEIVVSEDTTVTADDTVDVPIETVEATGQVNGVTTGAAVDVIDVIPNLFSVVVQDTITGGSGPESDEAFLARAALTLARYRDGLCLPRDYTAFALDSPLVSRATDYDLWDSVGGAPGDDPGHVTVAVYGLGGVLSAGQKQELEDEMAARSRADLVVHVIDLAVEVVPVTATVIPLVGVDATALAASVQAAVQAWIDPQAWTIGEPVRVLELAALLDGVTGVDYVDVIDAPATDVTVAELAAAGTVTITVGAP